MACKVEKTGHQLDQAGWKPTACERRIDKCRLEEEEEDYEIVALRRDWERCYLDYYGSFEDTTVPPMRYTFKPVPRRTICESGLQIFSVRVAQLKEEGLHWPLHVYGLIATRDSIDPRRNLLFHRTRDNCQILTEEDPFLLLTGPSRAVVLIDPVTFEIQLKAKCKTESEDKILNFNVFYYHDVVCLKDRPSMATSTSNCKRSVLEFAHALLVQSVEATTRVQVICGSWPDHIRGLLVSRTASINHGCIVLLDSRDGRMPISGSGVIELSRRVVSVELSGELKVDVVALQVDDENNVVARGQVVFRPQKASLSHGICDLGFCKLRVSVFWSLVPTLLSERVNGVTK